MKFYVDADLQKLQLRNAVIHPLGAAPSTPVAGQAYFDTGTGALRIWDGAAWSLKATDSVLHGGQTLAYVLARANATGTQLASTISDLATTVQGYRLDQFAAPTADVAFNSRKITGLADPTVSQDAATMGWVQTQVSNAAAGIDAKPSVRIATTANIALSGLTAIDGVTPVAGDRILVKNQTTASANGVYVAAAGAWTRAADADANNEMTPGAFWYVEEGTVNGKTQWRLENTGTIVVGTTALTINQFGGAGTNYTAGNGLLLTGSVFSVQTVAGGGIVAGSGGLSVDTAVVARKYSVTIGDGSASTFAVTHSLGTQDIIVSVREVATNAVVIADVVATSTTVATISFATAPTASQFRVTVLA
jgi:hypothetical protein